MKHEITIKSSHLGRMTPNTVLCFILTAIIHTGKKLRSFGIILTITLISLGLTAFLGYLAGVETAHGWGNMSRMALHTNSIIVARDGTEGMKVLYKKDEFADAETPDIILLDLNFPGMSGHEILAVIREDEKLKKIPVVVLTSSEAEKAVVETYSLHANSYIVKPVNLLKFAQIVDCLESFWFRIAVLLNVNEGSDGE